MEAVWIVMDTSEETGSESIKGVFATEEQAKYYIADYALDNDIDTTYLELVKKKIVNKRPYELNVEH